MAQTLTRLLTHIVFSAKERRNLITPAVEPELRAYLGGICRNRESPALVIGGTENHVHLLISLSKNIALSDLMMTLKKDSSKWIKTNGTAFRHFHWQDGYGAFSIGESQVGAVTDYIRGQKERHKSMSFEDELVALAERYGVAFDSRYLWT
ncbi:MAG: IS200/IS605 family transposase [Phycisphaerae bacterium]